MSLTCTVQYLSSYFKLVRVFSRTIFLAGMDSIFPTLVIKRFYSHLNTTVAILAAYKGEMPFAHFLKNFFSQYKKFGSKDRKQITELCFCYFRLGAAFPQLSMEQKVVKGFQLTRQNWPVEWLDFFSTFQLPDNDPENIFSFSEKLSEGVERSEFEKSFLTQPDLFLRIRPGYEKNVTDKLSAASVNFIKEDSCIRLPNSSKIDEVVVVNKEVVVQDYSSQRVGEILKLYQSQISNSPSKISIWDCCAASGGKSILAKDILKNINLTVSDIRPSILANLRKRFAEAGLNGYQSFIADATIANPGQQFDLVVADVPCSGSGTWARTPEQLIYFDEKEVDRFAALQQRILSNVINYLKPGGHLLFITCSVFAKENEDQVYFLQQNGLQLIEQKIIKGYHQKADTMFAALLKN